MVVDHGLLVTKFYMHRYMKNLFEMELLMVHIFYLVRNSERIFGDSLLENITWKNINLEIQLLTWKHILLGKILLQLISPFAS